MTQADYLNRLYILQNQIWDLWNWRRKRSLYGLRYTLYCNCSEKLNAKFEKTYRNYSAWCRRHHAENYFRRTEPF